MWKSNRGENLWSKADLGSKLSLIALGKGHCFQFQFPELYTLRTKLIPSPEDCSEKSINHRETKAHKETRHRRGT